MAGGNEFFDGAPPSYLQQGDILQGVPILLTPPSEELVILRTPGTRTHLQDLAPGGVEAVREAVLADAFDQPEYVAVSALRSPAMIMTQTCDLDKKDEYIICQLEPVEGSKIDTGNLRAGKYATLFNIPENDYLAEMYIDVTDLRPVRREAILLKNRILALSAEQQLELSRKLSRALGREWGYAPGDLAPQEGKYRCLWCAKFDVQITEITVAKDEALPECETCKQSRKRAQWYPLLPLKKRL